MQKFAKLILTQDKIQFKNTEDLEGLILVSFLSTGIAVYPCTNEKRVAPHQIKLQLNEDKTVNSPLVVEEIIQKLNIKKATLPLEIVMLRSPASGYVVTPDFAEWSAK